MKENCNLSHRLIAYILFVGLFLQSCGGFQNQIIPQEEKQPSRTLELPDNPLVSTDQAIVTSVGYLAYFYKEDGELKADLKADEKQPKPNYEEVPVMVEEGTDLSSLTKLDSTTQKGRIELTYSQSRQLRHITIHKGGLLGGMMEEEDDHQEKEKEKEKGIELAELSRLKKKIQQSRIQLAPIQGRKPSRVPIFKGRLSGGVRKEDEGSKNKGKEKGEEQGEETKLYNTTKRLQLIIDKKEHLDEANPLGNFQAVPLEILEIIFDHIAFPYILKCILINHFFYELITGYSRISKVDIKDKPNSFFHSDNWASNNYIDYTSDKFCRLTPETMPSFFFYRLIGEIRNIPPSFWPYLQGSNVHTINFSGLAGNKIGATGAQELAKALSDTKICSLDLSSNQIGDTGAKKLAKVLPSTYIHTIHLNSNQIGDIGAKKLAKALPNTYIHTLDLKYNQIGDVGAKKLAKALPNTYIHIIHLRENKIGPAGAMEFSKILPNTKIHTLGLNWNEIGDAGAQELAKTLASSQVHILNLSDNQIGDVGAQELAKALASSQVQTLNLSSNQIGDIGTSALAKTLPVTNIHILNLSLNEIENLGVIELAKALPDTNIHTLNLSSNQIGNVGSQELAKVLPNTNIHTLILYNNQIEDAGAIVFVHVLSFTKVHAFDLSANQIGAEVQRVLKQKNPKINFSF